MRLAAGAAGYGMASSVWPLRAVVAIGAAAADSELGRFHCDVVIRVVVVEARGRSRRRHRGCRRRLGERQRARSIDGRCASPARAGGSNSSRRQMSQKSAPDRLLAEDDALRTTPRSVRDGPFRRRFEWKS